ncbi:MAG: hypothetical protein IJ650_00585 [Paludibacteraceae bacterium]|nr:hypothetical protein [Paludibacteraceae bacterium]
MKKEFVILFGCAMMFVAFYSCSKEQSEIHDINPRMESGEMSDDEIINPYETLNVTTYISEHSSLFGSNIQVFDSLGEADSILNEWNSLSYNELRTQYSLRGYDNWNVECKITLDSLLHSIYLHNGYSLENELDDDIERQLDSLYYLAAMQYDPMLFYEYSVTENDVESEYYGQTYNVIEPRTELDLTALMNDHRLCIIEANVVKLLLDGTLITSPLLNYQYISGYESLEQLELLDTNNASSFADTTAIIWQPLYENNMHRSSTQKSYRDINYIYDNWYMMTINYKMARLYNLFGSGGDYNLCAHLTIKNYKKGCFNKYWLSRHDTNGEVYSETYIETNSMQGYANKQHYFYIDSKFATYIRYKSANVFVGFFRPYYEINYIHVSLTNGRNIIDAGDPDIRNHQ